MFTPRTVVRRPRTGKTTEMSSRKRSRIAQVLQETQLHKVEAHCMLPNSVLRSLNSTDRESVHGRILQNSWTILFIGDILFLWSLRSKSHPIALTITKTNNYASAPNRVCLFFRENDDLDGVVYLSDTGVVQYWRSPHKLDSPPISFKLPVDKEETCSTIVRIHPTSSVVCGSSLGRLFLINLDESTSEKKGIPPVTILSRSKGEESDGSETRSRFSITGLTRYMLGSWSGTEGTVVGGGEHVVTMFSYGSGGSNDDEKDRGVVVLSHRSITMWKLTATNKMHVWEYSLNEVRNRLSVLCKEEPTAIHYLHAIPGRRTLFVLLSCVLSSGEEAYFVATFKYLYATKNKEEKESVSSSMGTRGLEFGRLLWFKDVQSQGELRWRLNLAIGREDSSLGSEEENVVLYVFGPHIVAMKHSGADVESHFTLQDQWILGGGITNDPTLSFTPSPSASTGLFLSDGYGVISATFKFTPSNISNTNSKTSTDPLPIIDDMDDLTIDSDSKLESKDYSFSPQPSSREGHGGNRSEGGALEILRTAYQLYSLGQEQLGLSKIRELERMKLKFEKGETIEGLIEQLSLGFIDALPFAGKTEKSASTKSETGETALMSKHLSEKKAKHLRLVEFLHKSNLFPQLSLRCREVLRQYGEMIEATIKFRELLNNYPTVTGADSTHVQILKDIIIPTMQSAIVGRGDETHLREGLSISDVFFSRVSCIGHTFIELDKHLGLYLQSSGVMAVETQRPGFVPTQDTKPLYATAVLIVCNIYEILFRFALKFRFDNSHLYEVNGVKVKGVPSEPWTFSSPLRSLIQKHLHQNIRGVYKALVTQEGPSGTKRTREVVGRSDTFKLLEQLFGSIHRLSQHFLSQYQEHLTLLQKFIDTEPTFPSSSPAPSTSLGMIRYSLEREYVTERSKLSELLKECSSLSVNHRATRYKFAEDFQDFRALVELCDEEILEGREEYGEERLLRYLQTYQQDFANVLFQAYFENGKAARLVLRTQPPQYAAWLDQYLSTTPQLSYLNWTHKIAIKDFQSAAQLLDVEAEKQYSLGTRKTLLSLSKLSVLAIGGDSSLLSKVNSELDVVRAQEKLLDIGQGQDVNVLSPTQLIKSHLEKATRILHKSSTEELYPMLLPSPSSNAQEMSGITSLLAAFEVYQKAIMNSEREKKNSESILDSIWEVVLSVDQPRWEQAAQRKSDSISDGWLNEAPPGGVSGEELISATALTHVLTQLHSTKDFSHLLPSLSRLQQQLSPVLSPKNYKQLENIFIYTLDKATSSSQTSTTSSSLSSDSASTPFELVLTSASPLPSQSVIHFDNNFSTPSISFGDFPDFDT